MRPLQPTILPHPIAPSPDGSRASGYTRLIYDPAAESLRTLAAGSGDTAIYSKRKVLERNLSGDTLTLVELQGSDTVQVAFGDSGDWVPMHEGDVITRAFDKIRIRDTSFNTIDSTFMPVLPPRAMFVVSWGPFMSRAFKPRGFVGGFPIVRGVTSNTGVDVFDALPKINVSSFGNPLRFGGQLAIRNMDASSTIWLYYGTPGAFDATDVTAPRPGSSWPIRPDETFSIDVDNAMRILNGAPKVAGSRILTLCVASAGITPLPYALMLSKPATDVSDWNSDSPYDRQDP